MEETKIQDLRQGVNQSGLRNYNERLILSLVQRFGPVAGSDLARRASLSPQTVSVILRGLERDGLVLRGEPQRGRVGKPSIPMTLASDGAFSLGLKIGRRSAELLLCDLNGAIRARTQRNYRYPLPAEIFAFLREGMAEFAGGLSPEHRERIAGIGIAAPFELWSWHETVGAPKDEFDLWRDVDFTAEIAKFSDLPVVMQNDATAACRAEQIYGRGKEFRDYAYFYVGSFIGGGVVLNHAVYDGHQGNAGALGSLWMTGPDGRGRQLIDLASLYLLEASLKAEGRDPSVLWNGEGWHGLGPALEAWIAQAASALAKAALSICAVIDFEAVLIDGAFPGGVRDRLVAETARNIRGLDARGVIPPAIEPGTIGIDARPLGAASGPLFSRYLLDANAGLPG